jgi:UPF0716 protein FxsA
MWIVVALITVPVIEIALFIRVGGAIGLWPTIAIVIATAVAGAVLLRREGLRTVLSLQEQLLRGGDPSPLLLEGALILFAAALLLTPGFFTDTVGLLLLIPRLRAAAAQWLRPRLTARVVTFGTGAPRPGREAPRGRPHRAPPIDAEYREVPTGPERREPPRD